MANMRPYYKLIRPKQWIKNLFVAAPLVFSKELFDAGAFLLTLTAMIGFCLTASAVYIINDITDVEADRAHPEKRTRPLAAGTISPGKARLLSVGFLVATALLVIEMDLRYVVILAVYFLMNLAYSIKLKEIVLLDVFMIAGGFMLRVLAGAYAIDVRVSSWIVLCTLFISLFLGFAKRRGELILSQQSGSGPERKVLLLYRVAFIDQMLTIAAAGTVISYALYTVAPRTIEVFGTEKMIYTTVFVIYGIFRYLYLIHMTNSTENPTTAVTSDAPIIVTVLLWIVACVTLIYSGGQIPYISK
ncbi:MAG: decaprenyl-phosphate phosphoribosyltransferase [Ignavibacteriae bacterium]|nr:decaprenyl-phosphate phosphoribosyltransferase [Ignavibacteriota bacterium]